jgi:Fur family transcriptional regulator, peroxide stress response regulator
MGVGEADKKTEWFVARCHANGLKVTPQRVAVYKELIGTDEHPSAERLYEKVSRVFPNISLDTVNRALLTLTEIGAASIVAGSGDAKRFDGNSHKHQHFKCIRCKKIVDFHHKAFDEIKIPAEVSRRFKILRKCVYIEGICNSCRRHERSAAK